jgi:hypothetical protein
VGGPAASAEIPFDELRRWQAVTLGRAERILELKCEMNALLAQAGQPPHDLNAEEVARG